MIYEYRCNKCSYLFEKLVNNLKLHTASCPKCESVAHKVPSVSNFNLVGSGFYKNDYKEKKDD